MATAIPLPGLQSYHGGASSSAGPSYCCEVATAVAASAACLEAVEKQTAMIAQILHILASGQVVLQNTRQDVVLGSPCPCGVGATPPEKHASEIDVKMDFISPPAFQAQSVALHDHQCAMHALEIFSTDKSATITADTLVATTRALGFEEAFMRIVGEDLSSESIRHLFRGSLIDVNSIPFNSFNKAMKEFSEFAASMSISDQPRGSVDFGSLEALSIVKDAASDGVSIASTFDRTSEAHTQSCSLVSDRRSERRPSRFTTQSLEEVSDVVRQLGGYTAILPTESQVLGHLECIVIEPMGKQLAHARYVTTGVVICLHGMPPSHEVLQEWGKVLKLTGWLDSGISVALPNLQMSAALQQEDLESVILATLQLMKFHRCVIVAKFWGAQRAVELATSDRLSHMVDGLILVAPASPAPSACGSIEVPVLLLWARDDDIASYEEADTWIKALDERVAPSMVQDVFSGGHRFDRILETEGAAAAVWRFTTATLMMASLEDPNEESEYKRSQRIMRLSQDLPEFLQIHFEEEEEEDYDVDGSDHDHHLSRQPSANSVDIPEGPARRLHEMLPQWIQAGVPTASE